jgi:predicted dehydrogenase
MPRSVSVAIVGAGQRGLQLAEWFGRSERLHLAAVCDVDAERCRAATERLGVPAETDHRRLLERGDVEAVLIATGARWHAPVAVDALRAGRHVYCEKPLADEPAAARRMAEAAAAAGTVAVVGYQHRFSPFAALLAAELPPLEPVQALLTAQRGPMNPQYFFPEPYGGIGDYITHTVDMALWTMGGRPGGVAAHVRRGTILGDRTMEYLSLIVDFDGGERSATLVSSMFGVRVPNLIEYVGARGTLSTLDQRNVRVSRHAGIHEAGNRQPEGLETREVACEAAGDTTGRSLEHFAALVAGEAGGAAPHACTFAEGAAALAVGVAAALAAEQGRRVTLAELA